MKGIILAGGSGTRLHPITRSISKQLLPVYDKPMIYYPLSTLMMAGIREVLIITTPRDNALFRDLLGDGSQWGLEIEYAIQENPGGLAQAFLIGRDFVGDQPCCLVLGDNIFFGQGLIKLLRMRPKRPRARRCSVTGCAIPSATVSPSSTTTGQVISLEEKPAEPKSNYAVTGLYFYDHQVCDLAAELKPSPRGELEITDLNSLYLERGELELMQLGRGMAWLDTGTHDSLMEAAGFVETIEKRQGLKVCCPEEIAWRNHWIDDAAATAGRMLSKNGYGQYLFELLEHGSPA